MMTSQEVLALYQAMVRITDQMLQAATDSDWDRLVALEQQCAACVRQLTDNNDGARALDGQQRAQKVDAIRKMLDTDRKIRDLTTPWMARLSALINNSATQRRVARAYGV